MYVTPPIIDEVLKVLTGTKCDDPVRFELAEALARIRWQQSRHPLVFVQLDAGVFEVGLEGDTRTFRTMQSGSAALHLMAQRPGTPVPYETASPANNQAAADAAVRRAIKELARYCPPLADELGSRFSAAGGALWYQPSANSPRIRVECALEMCPVAPNAATIHGQGAIDHE